MLDPNTADVDTPVPGDGTSEATSSAADAPAAPIDRRAVVERHAVLLTAPHPEHVITLGNGDFAYTADITGMQTFTEHHDPVAAMRAGAVAINTTTTATWGWHEMPNPDGFVLEDAMSTYETSRGPVAYPDRHDMHAAMRGQVSEEYRPGAWLHANPQRIDLARIGLQLRHEPAGPVETDPGTLTDVHQRLDLWTGRVTSSFRYDDQAVTVRTVASLDEDVVAFRIRSSLLRTGLLTLALRFPYAHDGFFQTDDWTATDRHTSELRRHTAEPSRSTGRAEIRRTLDATKYTLQLRSSTGSVDQTEPHLVTISTTDDVIELVVRFLDGHPPQDDAGSSAELEDFTSLWQRTAKGWEDFWLSGAAVDFEGSSDPRAAELERRVVLSQYLTRVNCAGSMPPAETGLITNSWQGKSHLEMHFWHAAHFATWGRPELLRPSLDWYRAVLPAARATAARQGLPGARWPKHVGPDGRESPDPIGSLLAWQQPHVLYLLELQWRASDPTEQLRLQTDFHDLVEDTAMFMAAFPEERDGAYHLGPPIMPAQEFYDARSTTDPTFELAYWWWGLEIAQRWRERGGGKRSSEWRRVQAGLVAPHILNGVYTAVASDEPIRRDDHPSMLAALGVVPSGPLVQADVMEATLQEVLENWQWETAWGWDFPMAAMTAARLGRSDTAVEALLRNEVKNQFTSVGHNPQMGSILPLYLPANGSLLAAVSLMAAGCDDRRESSFPTRGWSVQTEGFVRWP